MITVASELTDEKGRDFRDIEIRIIAELMKNSRRSDREIAHTVGCSQPTVSRLIKRLEKEGVIKEYTMIPDFKRLGYQIMAVVSFGLKSPMTKTQFQKVEEHISEIDEAGFHPGFIGVNGMGRDRKNRLFVSFYRSYSDYSQEMNLIKNAPYLEGESLESFLVDLNEETVGIGVLSLSTIAKSQLELLENQKKK
jgi:DNA-binding Lrp family transcriptional regulator